MKKSLNKRSYTLLAGLVLVLIGCDSRLSSPTNRDHVGTTIWSQQKVETIGKEEKVIQFGMGPWHTAKETSLYMKPLLHYLEEKTGYRFVLNISENYDELVSNFQDQHIDIANLSASLYDQLLRESPNSSEYIATVTAQVGDKMTGHYRGIIFSHTDGKVRRLNDLKGKPFAFVDQGSSSGFKYPLAKLIEAGLEPERDFGEIFYVGNHDAVALAVAKQQVAGGAIWDLTLTNAEKLHGKVFRYLAETNPIPREAWIAQTSLPKELVQTIQEALTVLTSETRLNSGDRVFTQDAPFSGFVIKSEQFYRVVGETSSLVDNYLLKYPAHTKT